MSRFQIRLSTAVVAMVLASVLLGVNIYFYNNSSSEDYLRMYTEGFPLPSFEAELRSGGNRRYIYKPVLLRNIVINLVLLGVATLTWEVFMRSRSTVVGRNRT